MSIRLSSRYYCVHRGGGWGGFPQYAWVDFRGGAFPRSSENYFGLRLVRRVS